MSSITVLKTRIGEFFKLQYIVARYAKNELQVPRIFLDWLKSSNELKKT